MEVQQRREEEEEVHEDGAGGPFTSGFLVG